MDAPFVIVVGIEFKENILVIDVKVTWVTECDGGIRQGALSHDSDVP